MAAHARTIDKTGDLNYIIGVEARAQNGPRCAGGYAMKNYVLKIRLENTDISRTLAIPEGYGFADLHEIIQIAFGWEDYFYHSFRAGGTLIADDANEEIDLLPDKFKYEAEANLEFFLRNVKNFTYTYDIEQPWVHEIEVEGVLEEGFECPVLLEHTGRMISEKLIDDDTDDVSLGGPVSKNAINLMLEETFLY